MTCLQLLSGTTIMYLTERSNSTQPQSEVQPPILNVKFCVSQSTKVLRNECDTIMGKWNNLSSSLPPSVVILFGVTIKFSADLNNKIEGLSKDLNNKIEGLSKDLNKELKNISKEIHKNRSFWGLW
jgi:hypothetical protein